LLEEVGRMTDQFGKRIRLVINGLTPDLKRSAERDVAALLSAGRLSGEGLRGLLTDTSAPAEQRAIAAWIVGQIEERSLASHLEQILQRDEPTELILEAAKSLCRLGVGEGTFRRLLQDGGNEESRQIAAHSLGVLGHAEAAGDLCQALERDASPQVRGQAAEALAYLRDEASVGCVRVATTDPSPEVRFWAVFALGQLGSTDDTRLLERIAQEDHALVEGWGTVAKEAQRALEELRRRN
jgi:HEAT repeat protein